MSRLYFAVCRNALQLVDGICGCVRGSLVLFASDTILIAFFEGHAGFTVGQTSCSWFEWADFDEDGKPPWAEGYKGNANLALPGNSSNPAS